MESKKVTLNNGTVLEVGEKYRLSTWSETFYVECIKIHNDKYVMMELAELDDIDLYAYDLRANHNWLPYIEPTPQKEVLGSGNAMGTTKILVANSKGEEIFKIKDDIITINLNNMENEKITLNNGTELEEKGKYFNLNDKHYKYFEVLKIGNTSYFYRFDTGKESHCEIDLSEDLIPYTEPTPEKEYKTFLIEMDWTNYTSREILQFESMEIAKQHYNNAISITEVKINIEPVNN